MAAHYPHVALSEMQHLKKDMDTFVYFRALAFSKRNAQPKSVSMSNYHCRQNLSPYDDPVPRYGYFRFTLEVGL